MLKRVLLWGNELLHRPIQILWICLALAATGVFLDGTAYRLYGLWRDHQSLEEKIADTKKRSKSLESRIKRAQKPEFIEKAVRDQFDLVQEGDLVFLFSDEGADSAEKSTDKPQNSTP